jgi:hypothetical protein
VLLFDLIEYDIPASCLSKFIIDDGSRDGCEEEHVEEYKNDVKDIIGLVVLNGEDLEIGVEVPS